MPRFFLLVALCLTSQVSWAWNAEHAKIHQLILRFDYHPAQLLIQSKLKQSPKDPDYHYLNGLNAFTKALIESDPAFTDQFYESIEAGIKVVGNAKEDNYQLTFLGELRFFEAFMEFRDERELASSYSFLKAYRAAQDLSDNHKDFVPSYPLRIAVEALMSAIPEGISGYLEVLGFAGDADVAQSLLDKLNVACADENYAYLEAYTYFLHDYLQIQFDRKNFKQREVPEGLQGHPLIQMYRALYYANHRESAKALKIIDSILASNLGLKPYFMYYLKGKCMLQLGMKDAHYPLKDFVEMNPGVDFIKSANLYLSYHYLLKGNEDLSNYYKKQIGLKGNSRTGFDSYALRMIDEVFQIDLVKSLLLFDGGKLSEAEEVLLLMNTSSLNGIQTIEHQYRLARIYQLSNRSAKAIQAFKKTVDLAPQEKDYMQPNACLQLAKILIELNRNEEAVKYLKKCLEFNDYPYDAGLRYEAKTLLKSVS